MRGPCMCGDTCCPSCGPAQGNFKCPICRQWVSEGCEHFDEDGTLKFEFVEIVANMNSAERDADEQYERMMDEREF